MMPSAVPQSGAKLLNVLIADDNFDAAESLAVWLSIHGHEVRVVHDGDEAIAAFDAEPAEVAILDIGMPGLSGYDVARRMRRGSPDRPLTLIAVTGRGEDSDRARSAAAGFDHHFTKPVEPEHLTELLGSAHSK